MKRLVKHELKSWVGLFQPIYEGFKTHDLRVMDRVTKAVAGAWFGMMRPDGNSHLRFGLREGRPTVEVERALNILEAHGMVSREPDEFGGVTYKPLVDMSDYLKSANIGLKLTERIPTHPPGGKP